MQVFIPQSLNMKELRSIVWQLNAYYQFDQSRRVKIRLPYGCRIQSKTSRMISV